MRNRLRTFAHKLIGRIVIPGAPTCPACGSPFLIIDCDAYGRTIDTSEQCATCGTKWGQGSGMWEEAHPALLSIYSLDTCPCCGGDYSTCDCPLIVQTDGTAHCDEHDKACQLPEESEVTA